MADFDFEIKRNDYGEVQPLEATLERERIVEGEVETDVAGDPVWEPIDLTGKTVRILAEETTTRARIRTAAINLVAARAGRVMWIPEPAAGEEAADTAISGEYRFEFEITGPDGLQTVPRNSYYTMKIWDDLGP
jgi:hypothetical protein